VAFRRLLECDLDKNSVLKHGQAILRYDSLRGYTSYHCNEYPVLAHVVRKMTSQPYEMVKVLLDAGLINISEWGVFVGDWAARQPSNEGNRLAQLLRSYWVSIITEGYAMYRDWSSSREGRLFLTPWGICIITRRSNVWSFGYDHLIGDRSQNDCIGRDGAFG
jgi:hypothetical protein